MCLIRRYYDEERVAPPREVAPPPPPRNYAPPAAVAAASVAAVTPDRYAVPPDASYAVASRYAEVDRYRSTTAALATYSTATRSSANGVTGQDLYPNAAYTTTSYNPASTYSTGGYNSALYGDYAR